MDEDLIKILQQRIQNSSRVRAGLSLGDAQETPELTAELLDDYSSGSKPGNAIAASRIDAFLRAPRNHPIPGHDLDSIASALRRRLAKGKDSLDASDLRIALELYSASCFEKRELVSLVDAMKQLYDFSIVAAAPCLLPIIGPDFIRSYLNSTELSETGGMGGPRVFLIRDMAREALLAFQGNRTMHVDSAQG